MTIRKNIGTFRDGSAESMRRSVSTRKFADSVKSAVDGVTTRLDSTDEAVAAASTYTPSASAHWAGADPTTIAEALDRIAALLGNITVSTNKP